MSIPVKYGFKGKLYFNSGSYGSPTWNEVANVREVKLGAEMGEQEATTRAAGGIELAEPILHKLSVTGKIRNDTSDATGFVALRTAYLTRAILDIMVLDGPRTTNDSYGFRFDAKCFAMGEDQAIENILYAEFTLKPCISTAGNAACSVVVSAGAPVFTSLAA